MNTRVTPAQPRPLPPRRGEVLVVRYIGNARGDTAHRYFRRRHDALRFAARLRADGRLATVHATPTDWSDVDA